jgi:SAM-dependent methyltransferase
MKLAREAGWEPTGIELSEALATRARAHNPGAQVHVGDIMALDLESIGTFDVVIALDVIEHVLNPEDFLRRIHRLLNAGGRVILHTPNTRGLRARIHGGRWNMLIPAYHFFLFSPEGITGLLQRCGFEDVGVSTTSGTGLERGAAAMLAPIKEMALRFGGLGNALLVTGTKSPTDKREVL